MIIFFSSDEADVRLEKMNKLAAEVEELGRRTPPIFSAPAGFAAIKRIYVDIATGELVLVGITGTERRYAPVP